MEGQFVNEIVLDTACKRTMIRQELVPPEKIIEGDVATIRCAHGDTVLYPLANIEMKVNDLSNQSGSGSLSYFASASASRGICSRTQAAVGSQYTE